MLTARCTTTDVLDIDGFREKVLAKVDPERPENLMRVAEDLVALANNADLVCTRFTRELANWEKGGFSLYSPQSCVLDQFGPFVVRLNFWPLLPDDPRRRNILARVLSYHDCHDHNFSFLTTNYYGPGYETVVHEYDAANVDGVPGEQVRLAPQGRHCLDKGRVLLFRAGKELHTQLPPEQPSASINLMLNESKGSLKDQYYFDVDRQQISGYVESQSSKRNSLFGFCALLGDGRTDALLQRIARDYPSARTRACAYESLAQRAPQRAAELAEAAAGDPARIVQRLFQAGGR